MIRLFRLSLLTLVLASCAAPQKVSAVAVPKAEARVNEEVKANGVALTDDLYQITAPDGNWQVHKHVTYPDGMVADFLLQHIVGNKVDAVIVVAFKPAAEGGPVEVARGSREEDIKAGANASNVRCLKSNPPSKCWYDIDAKSASGSIMGAVIVQSVPKTETTVVFTGFWPPDQDAAMRQTFDQVAASLKVIDKK